VAERVTGPVRNLAGSLGPRVSEAAGAVRERASTVRERAHETLERRGMLDRLRDNPLPVLGVAFALGFLLAANDDDDEYGESRRSRARSELRSALMAGLSAGIAQGARGFLSQAGDQSTGFVNTLLDSLLGQSGGGSGGGESRGGGGSGGGRTGGGSTGGISRVDRGGSTGGTGSGRSGSYAGGGSTHRPPSHQEY
jgi:hypothetical protein